MPWPSYNTCRSTYRSSLPFTRRFTNTTSGERLIQLAVTPGEYSTNVKGNQLILSYSDAKSLRKEAFMDAFIELVLPSVLRVFTLSELHVVLAAGREWVCSHSIRCSLLGTKG